MLQPKDILVDLEKVDRTEEYLEGHRPAEGGLLGTAPGAAMFDEASNVVWTSAGISASPWNQYIISTGTETSALQRAQSQLAQQNMGLNKGNSLGGFFR